MLENKVPGGLPSRNFLRLLSLHLSSLSLESRRSQEDKSLNFGDHSKGKLDTGSSNRMVN